jgi:hypothetical protein
MEAEVSSTMAVAAGPAGPCAARASGVERRGRAMASAAAASSAVRATKSSTRRSLSLRSVSRRACITKSMAGKGTARGRRR